MRSATYRVFACLSALSFMPQLALADAFYCEGQINRLGLSNDTGRLWISYGAIGMQGICDVDATFNGTHPNACKAWLALLTAAHAQQKTIKVYYESSTSGNPSSCAGFQPWVTPYPYFIETVN